MMPAWASQAPPPPPPWKICTNRTPRSTMRRAARQSRPNGRVAVAIEAVERLRRRPLVVQLEGFGHRGLHAESQLIGLDARAQRRVVGIVDARQPIEPAHQAELGDLFLVAHARARA